MSIEQNLNVLHHSATTIKGEGFAPKEDSMLGITVRSSREAIFTLATRQQLSGSSRKGKFKNYFSFRISRGKVLDDPCL